MHIIHIRSDPRRTGAQPTTTQQARGGTALASAADRSGHRACVRACVHARARACVRACVHACVHASDVGIQDLWLANGLNASLDINCSAAAPAGADARTYTHTLARARARSLKCFRLARKRPPGDARAKSKARRGTPVRRFPRSGAQPLAHCRDDVQIPRELLDDLARAARARELRHLLEHVRVLGNPRGFNRWFLF